MSNRIKKINKFYYMDLTLIYTIVGFSLAAYSVIANDSVQTLGTFIASNQRFKWYWLATAASAVLTFTLIYGWNINDGDISQLVYFLFLRC